jgi:hypothetical protein
LRGSTKYARMMHVIAAAIMALLRIQGFGLNPSAPRSDLDGSHSVVGLPLQP